MRAPARLILVILFFILTLGACKPTETVHPKAIVGAILLDGQGGPPVSDSVLVIADGRIQAAGPRSSVEIPQGSETVDGSSKWLVPSTVDVSPQANPPGMIHAASPEDARTQVQKLAAAHAKVIHVASLDGPEAQAVMEAARTASIPVIAHISTEAEVEAMLAAGASGFVGMIQDRPIDPALVDKLRDLHLFFAPALNRLAPSPGNTVQTQAMEIAKSNTLKLFQAGVPIAVATAGGKYLDEAELLVEAGIPPLDVLVAATRNSAAAIGRLADQGTLQPGKLADLLLVSANPAEDIRNLKSYSMRMTTSVMKR
jgi:imidazolonepropionase-like amidohydrolase